MTGEEQMKLDREYVRKRWERAELCVRQDDKAFCISMGGRGFTVSVKPEDDAPTEIEAYSAARAYTESRGEEIRQLRSEIELIEAIISQAAGYVVEVDSPMSAASHASEALTASRILDRLNTLLTDALRGWKEPKS